MFCQLLRFCNIEIHISSFQKQSHFLVNRVINVKNEINREVQRYIFLYCNMVTIDKTYISMNDYKILLY